MDAARFDALSKYIGRGVSRRRVLRGLLGSSVAGGAVLAGTFHATARGKPCPSGNGSDCPRDQICTNPSASNYNCSSCGKSAGYPRGFFACKGTVGGGVCCAARAGEACCLCPSGTDTFGTCRQVSPTFTCQQIDPACVTVYGSAS
jgi:hypothetical protein